MPTAYKVRALHAAPRVALTIDTTGRQPPHVLLMRGTASIDIVDGVPPEYVKATRKAIDATQWSAFEAEVRSLYKQMARITITPQWAKLLDFETTLPSDVERLVREREQQQRTLRRPAVNGHNMATAPAMVGLVVGTECLSGVVNSTSRTSLLAAMSVASSSRRDIWPLLLGREPRDGASGAKSSEVRLGHAHGGRNHSPQRIKRGVAVASEPAADRQRRPRRRSQSRFSTRNCKILLITSASL